MAAADESSAGDTQWVRSTVIALAVLLGIVLFIAGLVIVVGFISLVVNANYFGSNK